MWDECVANVVLDHALQVAGSAPLHIASQWGKLDAMKALLVAGAVVDQVDVSELALWFLEGVSSIVDVVRCISCATNVPNWCFCVFHVSSCNI
jgi:hypothetical protein